MKTVNVHVSSEFGDCKVFQAVPGGKHRTTAVIISPIRLEGEGETVKVVSGCNHWKSCYNPDCFFSLKARSQ